MQLRWISEDFSAYFIEKNNRRNSNTIRYNSQRKKLYCPKQKAEMFVKYWKKNINPSEVRIVRNRSKLFRAAALLHI